jgi:hypothetical protein
MLIAFWIVNGLTALLFLAAGSMKVIRPKAALADMGMAWTADFNSGVIKAIGAAQVLGAIGMILPALLNIVPILSPIAATCIALIMLGAVVVHARRKESVVVALVLMLLAVASAILGYVTIAG